MTEKTTPELPFTLAKDGDGDALELGRSSDEGYYLRAIHRSGAHRVLIFVDPAEMMRNLAAFMPEVEPVGWTDAEGKPVCGTPGDAAGSISEGDYNAMHERARKAEARVRELREESERRGEYRDKALVTIRDLRADVERYKAALEAAEEYIEALTAAYEAEAEARYASQSASAADDHQRHKYDAYTAARAAVEAEAFGSTFETTDTTEPEDEAETSEEADRD